MTHSSRIAAIPAAGATAVPGVRSPDVGVSGSSAAEDWLPGPGQLKLLSAVSLATRQKMFQNAPGVTFVDCSFSSDSYRRWSVSFRFCSAFFPQLGGFAASQTFCATCGSFDEQTHSINVVQPVARGTNMGPAVYLIVCQTFNSCISSTFPAFSESFA